MYYYSVSYRVIPSTLPPEIQKEVGDDYEMIFLFGHQNKRNDKDFRDALESYLHDNKINYDELTIMGTKEITEDEYIDRTQYK